jgi:hypothetical protein
MLLLLLLLLLLVTPVNPPRLFLLLLLLLLLMLLLRVCSWLLQLHSLCPLCRLQLLLMPPQQRALQSRQQQL